MVLVTRINLASPYTVIDFLSSRLGIRELQRPNGNPRTALDASNFSDVDTESGHGVFPSIRHLNQQLQANELLGYVFIVLDAWFGTTHVHHTDWYRLLCEEAKSANRTNVTLICRNSSLLDYLKTGCKSLKPDGSHRCLAVHSAHLLISNRMTKLSREVHVQTGTLNGAIEVQATWDLPWLTRIECPWQRLRCPRIKPFGPVCPQQKGV